MISLPHKYNSDRCGKLSRGTAETSRIRLYCKSSLVKLTKLARGKKSEILEACMVRFFKLVRFPTIVASVSWLAPHNARLSRFNIVSNGEYSIRPYHVSPRDSRVKDVKFLITEMSPLNLRLSPMLNIARFVRWRSDEISQNWFPHN